MLENEYWVVFSSKSVEKDIIFKNDNKENTHKYQSKNNPITKIIDDESNQFNVINFNDLKTIECFSYIHTN